MLTYDLSERGTLPLYEYLARQIREDILTGVLPAQSRLPSRRTLAQHLGVSMVTVDAAYAQLVDEGYLLAAARRGYFVAASKRIACAPSTPSAQSAPSAPQWRVDLTSNHPAQSSFPFSTWARLTRAVISQRGEQLLQPVPFNGVPELRAAIAAHLRRFRGLDADPDCIVVGAGTEYLYHLLIQFLGRDKRYAVEDPCYGKIAQIYRMNGAPFCYLEMDEQGVKMDDIAQSHAEVVHTSPSHHFPTGVVTSLARRQQLLAWAAAAPGRCILEDDYDSEFRFTGKPIRPLQSLDGAGRVIYLNTFSKTISPSFRISYLVLPRQMAREFQQRMAFYSGTVPALEQYVLARFLDDGYFERHIGRMKRAYRLKRDGMIAAIEDSGLGARAKILEPDAGLHFLLKLNTTLPDAQLRRLAAADGIRLAFLSDYCHRPTPQSEHCILFNYSGVDSTMLPYALARIRALI
ncbi:MAG: PLP-dependent aminotransferase family protein [Oscillospiraceae bacterium]|nr:PLP-dependent aminotransferase family protein [Oscillospiraceae bacterium]